MRRNIFYLSSSIVLLLLAFLLNRFEPDFLDFERSELNRIEKNLNREYQVLINDLSTIKSIIEAQGESKHINNTKYPIYVYKDEKLINWSDYHIVPEYDEISHIVNSRIFNLNGSILLVVNNWLPTREDTLLLTGLIPLAIYYPVSNKYLRNTYNEDIFRSSNLRIIAGGGKNVIKLDGKPTIGIEFSGLSTTGNPLIIFGLFLGGLFFLFKLLSVAVRYYHSSKKYLAGFLLFSGSLLLLRVGMISLDLPFSVIKTDFFDPRYYASSYLNSSFGDLFLNVLVIGAIVFYVFSNYHKYPIIRVLLKSRQRHATALVSVLIAILFLGGYYIYMLILSISTHSQWNLDISENLDFNYFRLSSYVLFFVATISFIMVSSISFNLIKRVIGNRRFIMILTALLAGLSILSFFFDPGLLWLLSMVWMYSLLIKYFRIPGNFNRLPYATFIFIAFTTVLTSSLGALAIYQHHKNKIRHEKERYADHLIQQNDIMAEYYLAEAADNIRDDVFIQSRLLSPFATKEIIREKIRRVYLSNYFEKYDINILLFNSRGHPFSNTGLDYHEFREDYAYEEFQTEYDELFLINANQPGYPTLYLNFLEIERYSSVVGYILIYLRLKRVVPTNVFPRLLVDDRFDMNNEDISFGYVMYKQGELVTQSGEHQKLPADISLIQEDGKYLKGFNAGDNSYIGFNGDNGTVILISSDKYNFRKYAGNFSFLYCVMSLVLLMLLLIVAGVYQLSGKNLNYATRIQLFLNIAFIIPLVVVSITTLTRLTRNYTEEMDERYQDIAENLAINITPFLEKYFSNTSEIVDREELTNELSVVANIAECDLNLFGTGNLKGRLISSTQSIIYEKGILSRYINPVAGEEIYSGVGSQFVLKEKAGALEYKSAYTRIESPGSGNLLGVLSIPFFSSKQEINDKISDLLVNILNIFTIIFIIFLVISYFTSFYLTQPIQLLIQKIRKTSLEGDNEPLKYTSNDEIGQIVNEYNKMLIKLKESRIALAKTEKESAWREMARQVAHEIKNPLTPMKLTIQHLGMRIKSRKDDESKMLEKSMNSLLHNIETLNGIASSFSTYAQMPVPEIEEFDIQGLLRKTASLYSNEGEAQIKLELPEKEIITKGDSNWLGRAISNLIINGIQAVGRDHEAIIQISLVEKENAKILISIQDNGGGIDAEVRDKVFMPNFSTKYSGSGIGLAVAKRAVEHANGKIWFETSSGEGTTFYVELPSSG